MRRWERIKESPDAIRKAVDDKVVAVSDAAKVAKEPAEKQLLALERVKSGQAKTLVQGLEEPKATNKAKSAIRAAGNHQPSSDDSEPELDSFLLHLCVLRG